MMKNRSPKAPSKMASGNAAHPAGMMNRSPKAPSEMPKGASVNSGATRSSTAPHPKSLGPRTA